MDWYQSGLHRILPDLHGGGWSVGGWSVGSTSAGCGPLCWIHISWLWATLLDPHQLAVGHSVGSTSAGCGPLCCRVGAGGSGLKAGVARVNVTPAVPASGDAMQGKGALPAYGGGGGGLAMGIGGVALGEGEGESWCAWRL